MAKVLLAGGDNITKLIAEYLAENSHEVTQIGDARNAANWVRSGDFNLVIVESCLSVEDSMRSVTQYSAHPAELWVAAAAKQAVVPCVIFHENERNDWNVQMAEEYLNAIVVIRPSSTEDDPDYDQEDHAFVKMIIETALNAFQAKIVVPIENSLVYP